MDDLVDPDLSTRLGCRGGAMSVDENILEDIETHTWFEDFNWANLEDRSLSSPLKAICEAATDKYLKSTVPHQPRQTRTQRLYLRAVTWAGHASCCSTYFPPKHSEDASAAVAAMGLARVTTFTVRPLIFLSWACRRWDFVSPHALEQEYVQNVSSTVSAV